MRAATFYRRSKAIMRVLGLFPLTLGFVRIATSKPITDAAIAGAKTDVLANRASADGGETK